MKKKMFAMVCTAMLAVTGMSVSAEDLEVQLIQIGAEEAQADPISLDDIQMETVYELPGYVTVKPLSYKVRDHFVQYLAGWAGNNDWRGSANGENMLEGYYIDEWYNNIQWQKSGTDAQFIWLLVDVTNLTKDTLMISEDTEVKVIYDDEYPFTGWIRQFDYNYDTWRAEGIDDGYDEETFVRAALDPADEQPIGMLYTGHYVFGCTLPNAVIEGDEPLRMEITIGGNELTYHIRK